MKWFVAALVLMLALSCDELEYSTIVVTGQVARTLEPESNTASVLLGKATVENLLHDDWMETPDPGDSSFLDVFPAKLTPIEDADVKVSGVEVAERLPGVYFKPALNLVYLERYELAITTPDGKTIAAHGFLPDSFSIIEPLAGDSFGFGPLRASWTESDSSQAFVVSIIPPDSVAQGWTGSSESLVVTIPAAAFQDTLGNNVAGQYTLTVTAVNGGWNKSGLDLFLSGGNVDGAVGTFGCAVLARPVVFRVGP